VLRLIHMAMTELVWAELVISISEHVQN